MYLEGQLLVLHVHGGSLFSLILILPITDFIPHLHNIPLKIQNQKQNVKRGWVTSTKISRFKRRQNVPLEKVKELADS